MRILIYDNYQSLSKWTAHYIARKINRAKSTADKPFILGLTNWLFSNWYLR